MADQSTALPLTRESVQAAHKLIEPYIHKTPVLTNATLNRLASTPRTEAELEGTEWAGRAPAKPVLRFWFKCENFQKIGAFKARGAFHAIERLKQEPGWAERGGRERGVVTHSSGNHAQALSLAALTSSIPAHIIMPSTSSPAKIAATRSYGAHITFSGPTAPEREAVTSQILSQTNAAFIPPYDHPYIILGQGTAALELLSQTPTPLDAIITPCGGGGLLSGTALACEGTRTLVFGAEPSLDGADDCRRGLLSHARVETVPAARTIADGLRTPVGKIPWSIIHDRGLVRAVYAVSEDEIRKAMRLVWERMKIVVEPSAVVGLAAALYNEEFRAMVERDGGKAGWDLGVVFSGGNVSLEMMGKLFAEE
ncbi:tryptophan synthase beta subunit-like PLP-dependent enzyme [Parathielavia appendiculata]|uniref:Tryptophan synthase beta subunit-like PLP-dependent enzyme n=1 Tax=Parathielavia appendiculata TaxID=2587402 RepID=A0AAN6TUR3_9PEZI|nr:tryptophan synthase beta subunit-like PLP-dependent enzyme [Parathielavia appendiculata]